MSKLIRTLIGELGFKIIKTAIINLRGRIIHPLEMGYTHASKSPNSPILIDIPVSKCRTQLWHTLEESRNPFVKTIVDYYNQKIVTYKTSALNSYYENNIPHNAAEALRLPEHQRLNQAPAYGYILPWDNHSIDDIIEIRKKVILRENKEEHKNMDLLSGHTDFGPVTDEKGELEFNRLVKVFTSIKKGGYIEKPFLPDGGIKGYFLIDKNNEWCFIIKSGKHRAYALSAMGRVSIPVVIDNTMDVLKRIIDTPFWPQVKNSFFSEQEALSLVHNILYQEHAK